MVIKKTTAKKPATKKPAKKIQPVEKKVEEKPIEEKSEEKEVIQTPLGEDLLKTGRYIEDVGRRKTAVARVRLFTQGDKVFIVNDKPYEKYFPTFELQEIVSAALKKMKCFEKFRVVAKVMGGGVHAQAEAIRHGIAQGLVRFNPDFRKRLRRAGYLTRDPRMRERKKFGLKRARRAPQWGKR